METGTSSKLHLTIFFCIMCFMSCTNIFEKDIPKILCVSDATVWSSKRYEVQGIGEWYIIESYFLSPSTAQKLKQTMKFSPYDGMVKHPALENYYWIDWQPLSTDSPNYDILLESVNFATENVVVSEYKTCCNNNTGYYSLLTKDSTEINDSYYEKTAVVFDTITNKLFICNYHY